jgi:WXG100 family type VII secretion target
VAAQHFTTEVAAMQAGATHVREINALIDTDLRSLLAKLEALFGTWQGSAAQSFHGLKDQWVMNEQKLNTALIGIADTLELNSRHYDATEQAATADFNSATGALG